ncbi:hypothetical protein ACJX0J_016498, partial [Zea mays]
KLEKAEINILIEALLNMTKILTFNFGIIIFMIKHFLPKCLMKVLISIIKQNILEGVAVYIEKNIILERPMTKFTTILPFQIFGLSNWKGKLIYVYNDGMWQKKLRKKYLNKYSLTENGEQIRFWENIWVGNQSLIHYFHICFTKRQYFCNNLTACQQFLLIMDDVFLVDLVWMFIFGSII